MQPSSSQSVMPSQSLSTPSLHASSPLSGPVETQQSIELAHSLSAQSIAPSQSLSTPSMQASLPCSAPVFLQHARSALQSLSQQSRSLSIKSVQLDSLAAVGLQSAQIEAASQSLS